MTDEKIIDLAARRADRQRRDLGLETSELGELRRRYGTLPTARRRRPQLDNVVKLGGGHPLSWQGQYLVGDLLDWLGHWERDCMLGHGDRRLLQHMRERDGLPLGQRQKLAGIVLRVVRCYAEPPEPPARCGVVPVPPTPSSTSPSQAA